MIGRAYRGARAGGLVRYLYGPGRFNEHANPRLVAAWAGSDEAALSWMEPAQLPGGGRDFGGLTAELEAPLAYAERPPALPVFHVALRTAPGDRVLSDAEWGAIARDVMDRTGFAPEGDDGGCRWIAVRHGEDHIHVAAVLARQDGARVSTSNDFHRIREACRAAEDRYGLAPTAAADRTAARHTSRPEVEKAARVGLAPARDWLRSEVQAAAVVSREPGEFLDRLRAAGVVVKERHGEDGALTGYAVGRGDEGQDAIFFGGGKLAADLSLPKLQSRWSAAGAAAPAAGMALEDPAARAAVYDGAIAAAAAAADEVRELAVTDPDRAGDAAAAAADILAAAGRLVEGDRGGPLTQAGRDYDRAARETYGRTPDSTQAGQALRFAATQLMVAGMSGVRRAEAARVALLIAHLARLTESVRRLRAAQDRLAQADAANSARATLVSRSEEWMELARRTDRGQSSPTVGMVQRAAAAAIAEQFHTDAPGSRRQGPGAGRGR
jgi:hypothetical protein